MAEEVFGREVGKRKKSVEVYEEESWREEKRERKLNLEGEELTQNANAAR